MKKAENKVGMELIRQRMNTERSLDDFIPIGGDVVGGDRDLRVRGLVADSRRVTPGCAFFAMPGIRTDGAEHVEEAVERGAKVIITERTEIDIPSKVAKDYS